MDFTQYNSIENSYRQKILDEIYARGLDKEEWIVSEKIHGSNFSFWMDNVGLRCAKRSGFLSVGDQFFNWQPLVDAYEQHLAILYQMCSGMMKDMEEDGVIELKDDNIEVVLYGELFGGVYNHPDVEKDPQAKKVQKGVQYCPWNDFYAFDLKINGAYISYGLFESLMESCGFHFARSICKGDLTKCLKYPNDFESNIPKLLQLPPIEDNVAEGVVIKPASAKFFPNGSRVILKNKNSKFKEKEQKVKAPKPKVVLTEEEMTMLNTANELTTENRLRNVLSKIGEVTQKDFGKILGAFCSDIIEDLAKEDCHVDLDKDRTKILNKAINKNAQEMLRQHFVNIIDGTF